MSMTRWIKSSAYWSFYGLINSDIPLIKEGESNTDKAFAEFRLEGPNTIYLSATQTNYTININILILTVLNNKGYTHENNIDFAKQGFIKCFTVYEMLEASGGEAGRPVVGNFKRQGDLLIQNFGKVGESTNIVQSSVEAEYLMEL